MAGGPINTGNHPKLLWPGIKAVWGQLYNEHAKEYVDLYESDTSTRAYEEDVQVTGFGLAPAKPEGSPGFYDSEVQGMITRYTHVAYSLGYIVTHEELSDNQYQEVSSRRSKANAFSVNQTVETLAAFLYNNAFATTYFTTGDGVALCSSSHTTTSGGTYSNILATPADLSEASLEDMWIQIALTQNDRNLKVSVLPRTLHYSPYEKFNADRILKSQNQSGTGNNDLNVLRAENAFPGGGRMNHYFTSPHAWFVRTNVPRGMMMYWREKPSLEQDNDFDTKNAKALCYFRVSFGCTDPRGIFGSNGP